MPAAVEQLPALPGNVTPVASLMAHAALLASATTGPQKYCQMNRS
ncbi:MAG: hypothetical protein U5J98_08560 [Halobacteriales archaeon]|nr:hypothetical protein [Halobacteriales archaeon]